eukprot:Hpha_TRINITY_DN16502_c0_g1::TRINITY_DN16502_c0_g1_i1::g.135832::m.135832
MKEVADLPPRRSAFRNRSSVPPSHKASRFHPSLPRPHQETPLPTPAFPRRRRHHRHRRQRRRRRQRRHPLHPLHLRKGRKARCCPREQELCRSRHRRRSAPPPRRAPRPPREMGAESFHPFLIPQCPSPWDSIRGAPPPKNEQLTLDFVGEPLPEKNEQLTIEFVRRRRTRFTHQNETKAKQCKLVTVSNQKSAKWRATSAASPPTPKVRRLCAYQVVPMAADSSVVGTLPRIISLFSIRRYFLGSCLPHARPSKTSSFFHVSFVIVPFILAGEGFKVPQTPTHSPPGFPFPGFYAPPC